MRLTRRGISWGDAPQQTRTRPDRGTDQGHQGDHAEQIEADREVRSMPVPRYVLRPSGAPAWTSGERDRAAWRSSQAGH